MGVENQSNLVKSLLLCSNYICFLNSFYINQISRISHLKLQMLLEPGTNSMLIRMWIVKFHLDLRGEHNISIRVLKLLPSGCVLKL